jgi:hypothetical protein
LKRIQALQDRRACTKDYRIEFNLSFWAILGINWKFYFWIFCRLETCVSSKERIRESISKKYRNFHIPWEWMMDTGLIGQVRNT